MKTKFIVVIILIVVVLLAINDSKTKLSVDSFIENLYVARSESDSTYLKEITTDDVFEKIKDDNFVLDKISHINTHQKLKNKIVVTVGSYGYDFDRSSEESYFYSDEIVIERIDGKWIITRFSRG